VAKIRVLYIQAAGAFGGSSKSLCEMLKAMPRGAVEATVLCPRGTAAAQFEQAGARVVHARGISIWDHTRYGRYRGLRWMVLMRELFHAVPTILGLRRARSVAGAFDIIHANDATVIGAGILAKRTLGAPLVVHVRCLMCAEQRLYRTRMQNALLRRYADAVVSIDENVRRTLPEGLNVTVIHNGLRMPPQSETVVRDRLKLSHRRFRVAIVGVLLRLKGVFEFAAAALECSRRGLDIEFWIAGENVRSVRGLTGYVLERLGFAEDVRGSLEKFVSKNGLQDRVRLLGFVADVNALYREVDVLCFPSHLDAPGRPVFEAAWFGVPSIVAARDPSPDTIIHGQTGLCIPRPDAKLLADAIERLYDNPEERASLAAGAQALAKRHFDARHNARSVLELYRSCIVSERALARQANEGQL
jgi:glycosyltransferase involved in cell wall biosynthesis